MFALLGGGKMAKNTSLGGGGRYNRVGVLSSSTYMYMTELTKKKQNCRGWDSKTGDTPSTAS